MAKEDDFEDRYDTALKALETINVVLWSEEKSPEEMVTDISKISGDALKNLGVDSKEGI